MISKGLNLQTKRTPVLRRVCVRLDILHYLKMLNDKNLLCVHFYRTEHEITEHRINQMFQWKSKKFPSSWDWK